MTRGLRLTREGNECSEGGGIGDTRFILDPFDLLLALILQSALTPIRTMVGIDPWSKPLLAVGAASKRRARTRRTSVS